MGNTPNVIDFSKTLANFLNDPVSDGTWNQVVGSILKADAVGEEAAASDIDVAAGQLWSNLVDDYFRKTYPSFYRATKVWVVADATERDALGSTDGLAVNDLVWVTGLTAFFYAVSVLGPASSTWAEVVGTVDSSPGLRWEFDAGIADADPGSGKWRYDDAIQADSTFIFVNNDCFDGIGFRNFFLDLLNIDNIFLQAEGTPAKARRWLMNGAADASPGTYVRIPITFPPATAQGTDFVAGDIVQFFIHSIVEGLGAVLTRDNQTLGTDIVITGSDKITSLVSIPIETAGADDVPVVNLRSTGANGAITDVHSGDRSPIGAVTAEPGSIYFRVSGVTSQVFQHIGASADNTSWALLGGGGGLTFTAVKTGAFTAAEGDLVPFDPSGGTFTLTFPGSPATDAQVGFKNVTASTVAITLAGNGNTVEDPASFGVSSSVSVGGNGLSLRYQFDGTSWFVV